MLRCRLVTLISIYHITKVISNILSPHRCLCCLADQGSEMREIAVTSGLWSVCSWKSRPSSMCLKCLIVWAAARSSRSNVEYLISATLSLREKKPNGCQEPPTCWFSTPPMCLSPRRLPRRGRGVPAALRLRVPVCFC